MTKHLRSEDSLILPKKKKIRTSVKYEEVDVLVVGGGISGCYFARQVDTHLPELKVRVLEASHRIGGRLLSHSDPRPELVKDELGGMRIFPERMPMITKLTEEFGLHLQSLPLADDKNLFQYKGATAYKRDSCELMPVGGAWEGRKPTEMSAFALTRYKESEFWKKCKEDAYECEELRSMSVHEFFKKYGDANDAEIACWFAYTGYDLYHPDVTAAIWVNDGVLYGADDKYHDFVKEGFQMLVEELLPDNVVMMNTRVTELQWAEEGTIVLAEVKNRYGQLVSTWRFKARKVVIGMDAKALRRIKGLGSVIDEERMACIHQSKPIPLFKCFLEFPKPCVGKKQPWWQKVGFLGGKSTTDRAIRQIYYYDNEDILIYNSDGATEETKFASYWNNVFREDGKNGYSQIMRQLKDMHKGHHMFKSKKFFSSDEPVYSYCAHKYWPAGSHKWMIGANVRHCIDIITDGTRDKSNVFIVGDAFSDMQGWTEGAVKTSLMAFKKAFPGVEFEEEVKVPACIDLPPNVVGKIEDIDEIEPIDI